MKASRNDFLVVIIGPSAEVISGSLLRPINIYYSLRDLRGLKVKYIPVKKLPDLLPQLFTILYADMIIASGVNPWISALVTLWRKISRKMVIVDFHGFAWIEANATNAVGVLLKTFLLISEKISYKFSNYVITASKWLANTLAQYHGGRREVFVIENAVPYIFEKVSRKLIEGYGSNFNTLREYVCKKVLYCNDSSTKLLFTAPLPSVFRSNILAYEELLKLSRFLGENVLIAVTGIKKADRLGIPSNIVLVGHIGYVNYVALLLSSDGVILPYPRNAICGGVRNKVLEAGYCKKPVISTKTGIIHLKVLPMIHYIPINVLLKETIYQSNEWKLIAGKLHEMIIQQHGLTSFKRAFLELLRFIFRDQRNIGVHVYD